MVKRTYCLLFCFEMFYASPCFASAWLINEGKYRYTMSVSTIDKLSEYQKTQRADLYVEIEKRLWVLREYIKDLNKASARYKLISYRIKNLEKSATSLMSYQDKTMRVFA